MRECRCHATNLPGRCSAACFKSSYCRPKLILRHVAVTACPRMLPRLKVAIISPKFLALWIDCYASDRSCAVTLPRRRPPPSSIGVSQTKTKATVAYHQEGKLLGLGSG